MRAYETVAGENEKEKEQTLVKVGAFGTQRRGLLEILFLQNTNLIQLIE